MNYFEYDLDELTEDQQFQRFEMMADRWEADREMIFECELEEKI